jgi:methionyl-tRNA formyltransferase
VRIVFFGSGQFAVPSLEALVAAGHELTGVVTQPDRPRGRGRGLAPPPLKPVAESLGLRVLQPPRVKDPSVVEELRALAPKMQVVAAYGQLFPRAVIDIPPLGTINVHASLLPLYRGAAPIQRAVADGQRETGVTTMVIDEGLDSGPVLLSQRLTIGPEETSADLAQRLARLGATVLRETVTGLAEGRLTPTPQDDSRATLAPRLRKEEGRLDWSLPADVLGCRIRAFQPWPGAE